MPDQRRGESSEDREIRDEAARAAERRSKALARLLWRLDHVNEAPRAWAPRNVPREKRRETDN